MKRIIKVLLIMIGTIAVLLGVIGIMLPVLPTTPFLLLAAACYIRGSERLYHWLTENGLFGEYIKNYREGRGIPLKTKVLAIIFLWLTIGSSMIFVATSILLRVVLLFIAVGVTMHITLTKTYIP